MNERVTNDKYAFFIILCFQFFFNFISFLLLLLTMSGRFCIYFSDGDPYQLDADPGSASVK